jgi:hypothetical protein
MRLSRRRWILLGLLSGASLAGCDGTPGGACAGAQSCPAITATTDVVAFVPSGLPSPLVSVSGSPLCLVELDTFADAGRADGGAERPVSVQQLGLQAGETSVCHIHGTLANGGEVAADVTYAPVTINCCPGFDITLGQFTPLDAGAGVDAR